jgi:NhaP-type Na+/H+ or K+/H+ antiporter
VSDLAVGLAAVIVVGVTTQWMALRLGIPMVLPLLAAGVLVGPVLSLVEPQDLFGETLFPAVSLGVGILLFEGGLGLRLDRLGEGRNAVLRLVTIGAVITWMIGSLAAWWFLDLTSGQAVLLGAILVVSGPTVVLPLLAQLRVRDQVDAVARWEGIVIDPIGAAIAVVVLELAIGRTETPAQAVLAITLTVVVGIAAGVAGAALITIALLRHAVPDNLVNSVTLMVVVLAFTSANLLRPEAGLFATVVMGVVLANQRRVSIRLIEHFEESLGLLILGALFIVLGASLDLDALGEYLVPSLGLLAVLVLVARPLTVLASTARTRLTGRDRLFLMAMMPRGIVAAAVAALFALELQQHGSAMEALVPAVYVIIFGTVILSSLITRPLSRRLRLAKPAPNGILIVGGDDMCRALGHELARNDVPVLIVPTDGAEREASIAEGLLSYEGGLDSDELHHALETVGIGQAVVFSRSEQLTSFVVPRLAELLGRANVYYLPDRREASEPGWREATILGRRPFGLDVTHEDLVARFETTARFETLAPVEVPTDGIMALVAIDADGRAHVVQGKRRTSFNGWRAIVGLGKNSGARSQ